MKLFDFINFKQFWFNKPKEVQSIQLWESNEAFDPDWASRILFMAGFIESGNSIVDLGCGPGWLKKFLPPGCVYYGCDAIARDGNTIVCDFNKNEFPDIFVDVAFISGVLEYVREWEWFIECSTKCSNKIVMSYCTSDYFPDRKYRKELGWVNSLSISTIIKLLEENGFAISKQEQIKDNSTVIVANK